MQRIHGEGEHWEMTTVQGHPLWSQNMMMLLRFNAWVVVSVRFPV